MSKASGWYRDLPDHRDFTLRHEIIADAAARLAARDGQRPEYVDWREYCPPVEDQRQLAASSAHACIGMVQYFERRAHGRQIFPSRLFVHKNARRLLHCVHGAGDSGAGDSGAGDSGAGDCGAGDCGAGNRGAGNRGAGNRGAGDCGASLRATLKAIRRFGLPPESLWPYRDENLDREPGAFAYSFSQEASTISYVRIDARNVPGSLVLESACALLAGGFCFVLGFPLSGAADGSPLLSYPTLLDSWHGGHAAVAVGYDDRLRIRSDKGAFLVRNSWGGDWGEAGYGWLPYTYVRERLAVDLWTIMRPDWLASGEFQRPELAT